MSRPFLFLLLVFAQESLFAISLQQAVDRKWITIHGSLNPLQPGETHSGKCLQLTVWNRSTQTQTIDAVSGYRFSNSNKDHQDLLCTEPFMLVLKPGSRVVKTLYAFCCNKALSSPQATDSFNRCHLEDPPVQEICALLFRRNLTGNTAQQAIWCICNEASVEDIYDTHPDLKLENEIATSVCKARNIPVPARVEVMKRILRYPVEVEGVYTQYLEKPLRIGVYITDTANMVLLTLLPEESENRIHGTVKYSYAYRGQLPEGTYLLQEKLNGEWRKEKEIHIQATY